MANQHWVAKQIFQAQINTITVSGSPSLGNTYTVTIGGASIVYTATGSDTNNTIAANLAALLSASNDGRFTEISWVNNAPSAVITGTAVTPGTPFTQTSSSSGGTLTTATPTANLSPSDTNDGLNWSTGSVPGASDNVFFDIVTTPALWNLGALSAVTVASITVGLQYTGQIGLPDVNQKGYTEYRTTYFTIGCSGAVNIGSGNQGTGSGLLRFNFGATAATVTCFYTAASLTSNIEALNLLGSNLTAIYIYGGNGALAPNGGDTATCPIIHVSQAGQSGSNPVFRCGTGCTLTTVVNNNGTLTLSSAVTTFTQYAGTSNIFGSGAITNLNINGGTCVHQGTGTITNPVVQSAGIWDLSKATAPITLTNPVQLYSGSTYTDPAYRAFGAVFKLNGCLESDVQINIGPNRTLTAS